MWFSSLRIMDIYEYDYFWTGNFRVSKMCLSQIYRSCFFVSEWLSSSFAASLRSPSVCKPLATKSWGANRADDGFPVLHQRVSISALFFPTSYLRLVSLFILFFCIYFHLPFPTRFLTRCGVLEIWLSKIYTCVYTGWPT